MKLDAKTRRQILRIIKHARRMRGELSRSEAETGMRHLPNEAYFKQRRKLRKRLERLDDETLLTIRALQEGADVSLKPGPAAIETLEGTYSTLAQRFERDQAIEHLLKAEYLDEDLEIALRVLDST